MFLKLLKTCLIYFIFCQNLMSMSVCDQSAFAAIFILGHCLQLIEHQVGYELTLCQLRKPRIDFENLLSFVMKLVVDSPLSFWICPLEVGSFVLFDLRIIRSQGKRILRSGLDRTF